jgi:amino acid adenylation domain-containing protein/non-ribosomal peptide synthase protein (TIGR01720 family)
MNTNHPATPAKQLSLEEKRQLVKQLIQKKSEASRPQTTEQAIELSFAQQRLWLLDQLQPHSTVYVLPVVLHLVGNINRDRLGDCLNQVLQRHEVLRTAYVLKDAQVYQTVLNTSFSWHPIDPDLETGVSLGDRATIQSAIDQLVQLPFDLDQAPMLRGRLLQSGKSEFLLVLTVHHIAADYRSLRILLQEMVQLYHGQQLRPLSLQYRNYASEQRQQQDRLIAQSAYWRKQLENPPQGLPLFSDYPRPAVLDYRGDIQTFTISASITESLRQLSRQHNATLFMTLLAAFKILLYRHSGQSDLLVGSTIDQRHRPELQPLVGLFVNNLVLRSRLEQEDSFEQVLQQVRQTCLDAYDHQDLPFEQLVEQLAIDRQLNQNPLFSVAFVLHSSNDRLESLELPHLKLEYLPQEQRTSRFDLSLDMDDRPDGLIGRLEYSTALFARPTIQQLIQHFETILAAVVTQPDRQIGQIELLSPADLAQLAQWNHTEQQMTIKHVLEGFRQTVVSQPNAIAVQADGQSMTYQQLDKTSDRLAALLQITGVKFGGRVGIALDRSVNLLVGLLAVMKLGAVYVPIDRSYPHDRIQHIIDDSGLKYLITDESVGGESAIDETPLNYPETVKKIDLNDLKAVSEPSLGTLPNITPEDTAYIIYTSGSTGKPKGVEVLHRGLANILSDLQQRLELQSHDRWLAVTTIAFDIAALELFLPLMVGATVVIANRQNDPAYLVNCLEKQHITVMQATPATWRLLLETDWTGSDYLRVLCGGEALNNHLARQLLQKSKQLWNLYGPTETTIWSAVEQIQLSDCDTAIVPIGKPIANTQFHVLDHANYPVAVGVPGQLYIGGEGLAKGYWHRPELTTERFINCQGQRLYSTGDQVRWRWDGRLDYLGRLDFQVKLRGYRIELGEIEAKMMEVTGVTQAAVLLVGEQVQQRLIGYYQSDLEIEVSSPVIEQHLQERLPGYMQPSELISVGRMPLTPNGKIDRLALVKLKTTDANHLPAARAKSLPETEIEQALAQIWINLLGVSSVYREDDFFAIGGHSLLAMRLSIQVQQQFGSELTLANVFKYAKLEQMATLIERHSATPASLTATIAHLPQQQSTDPIQLSLAQRRFWLLNQLEPESAAYHIPIVLRLSREIDLAKLQQCFEQVIQRHEILRTRYIASDTDHDLSMVKALVESFDASTFQFTTFDLSNFSNSDKSLIQEFIQRPFCLETDYPIRVQYFTGAAQNTALQNTLAIVVHHIAADAASVNLLLRELVQLYQGQALPPLTHQYSDYAAWQYQPEQVAQRSQQLVYWQEQLQSATTTLNLPSDAVISFDAPAQQGIAKIHRSLISQELTQRLKKFCQSESITLFMLLLASYGWILSRYSGEDEILIGSPIVDRRYTTLEPLIGCFANTIVLRMNYQGSPTVRELLQCVKQTTIAAYTHQDLPFEQLVEALQPERSISHHPIFQTMLVLQNAEQSQSLDASETAWEIIDLDTVATQISAKFDLLVNFSETESGLQGRWEYDSSKFSGVMINRLVNNFQCLLEQLIATPDRPIATLSSICPQELQQLNIWNQTQTEYALATLPELFTAQAVKTPNQFVVIDGDRTFTYSQFSTLITQYSQRLQQYIPTPPAFPQKTIGILLERRAEAVVAMLAVMQLGHIYVPIDVNYPAERIQYLLEHAAVCCLVTQASQLEKISTASGIVVVTIEQLQQKSAKAVTSSNAPSHRLPKLDDLAYLIYTSGSTGKPKGVAIRHRNVASLVAWAQHTFSPDSLRGVLASTSFCFDLSIFEIFVPLSSGGCVILAENALALPELAARDQITLINTVPSVMQALLQSNSPKTAFPKALQAVNLAGEALSTSLVSQLYQIPQVQQVYNLYGPSEDTTYSTFALIERGNTSTPSIGRPIANSQAYILDQQQQLLPIGAIGELYLAGDGVAAGYWQQPELTAERFIQAKIQGETLRLYRTGDRARWRQDGMLEYLGRFDFQVKLRGFRIELGEIEHHLESYPPVDRAVVMVIEQQMFAFYQSQEMSVDSMELRQMLGQRLPSHMVPNYFIPLLTLPLTINGKLDRRNLEAQAQQYLADQLQQSGTESEPPIDAIETALIKIWQQLFNRTSIDRRDNFFELGGDSILAIQMVAKARDRQLQCSPRQLFQFPTIAQFAEAIRANASNKPTLISQTPIVGEIPLSPIQKWFFAQNFTDADHWNQSLLLQVAQPLSRAILVQILEAILQQHDVLRSQFNQTSEGWIATVVEPEQLDHHDYLHTYDLSNTDDYTCEITKIATHLQSSLNLSQAPLFRIAYFDLRGDSNQNHDRSDRVLLILHHLLTDGLSWRILLTDWQIAHQQIQQGRNPQLPDKTTTYPDWTSTLLTQAPKLQAAAQTYWEKERWQNLVPLPIDFPDTENCMKDIGAISVNLDETLTHQLLQSSSQAYQTQINDLLLSALALTLQAWTSQDRFAIELESHGRDGLQDFQEVDTSCTIGWFTSLFPVLLTMPSEQINPYPQVIKSIKEQLHQVPHQGIGYGLFKYGLQATSSDLVDLPSTVRFNYLGQTASAIAESGFQIAPEFAGASRSPNGRREVAIEINAIVLESQLKITWQYSSIQYATTTIEQLARAYLKHLEQIIRHCQDPDSGGYTPSDFPEMDFSQAELDDFLDSL